MGVSVGIIAPRPKLIITHTSRSDHESLTTATVRHSNHPISTLFHTDLCSSGSSHLLYSTRHVIRVEDTANRCRWGPFLIKRHAESTERIFTPIVVTRDNKPPSHQHPPSPQPRSSPRRSSTSSPQNNPLIPDRLSSSSPSNSDCVVATPHIKRDRQTDRKCPTPPTLAHSTGQTHSKQVSLNPTPLPTLKSTINLTMLRQVNGQTLSLIEIPL